MCRTSSDLRSDDKSSPHSLHLSPGSVTNTEISCLLLSHPLYSSLPSYENEKLEAFCLLCEDETNWPCEEIPWALFPYWRCCLHWEVSWSIPCRVEVSIDLKWSNPRRPRYVDTTCPRHVSVEYLNRSTFCELFAFDLVSQFRPAAFLSPHCTNELRSFRKHSHPCCSHSRNAAFSWPCAMFQFLSSIFHPVFVWYWLRERERECYEEENGRNVTYHGV